MTLLQSFDNAIDELSRGRKARIESSRAFKHFSSVSTSNNNYKVKYNDIPKEVVVKIVKKTDGKQSKKNSAIRGRIVKDVLDYLAKERTDFTLDEENEEKHPCELELDNGKVISSKEEIKALYDDWKVDFSDRKNGRDAIHLVFSTSEKPNKENKNAVLDSVRETLANEFGQDGYNYAFAVHSDTENLHVHALLKTHNRTTGQKLDIRKRKLFDIKKRFAFELRQRGLNYTATFELDKVKEISEKLEFFETRNYTWFSKNLEKAKETDIKTLQYQITQTFTSIKNEQAELEKKKEEIKNLFYDKSKIKEKQILKMEIKKHNETITNDYTKLRTYLNNINQIEYELTQAVKQYESLKEKFEKIPKPFFNTKKYKELEEKLKNDRENMIKKKLDVDKAQLILTELKLKEGISINTNKSFDFTIENIKAALNQDNTFNIIDKKIDDLSSSKNVISKFNNNTLQELKQAQKNMHERDILNKIKQDIYKEMKAEINESVKLVKQKYKNKELAKNEYQKSLLLHAKIKKNLKQGYDPTQYDLSRTNINTKDFKTKEVSFLQKGLTLKENKKQEIILEHLEKSPHKNKKLITFAINQVKESNKIYLHQLQNLDINTNKLLKELKIDSFEDLPMKLKTVDLVESYIDKKNINQSFQELKENQKEVQKDFLNKVKEIIDKKEKVQEINIASSTLSSYEKVKNAGLKIVNSLKSNYHELESTNKLLKELSASPTYQSDVKQLEFNLQEYQKQTVKLNEYLNNYISNVSKSNLKLDEKLNIKTNIYETLEKFNYDKKLNIEFPKHNLKQELINRKIDYLVTLNKTIKNLDLKSPDFKTKQETSKQLVKDIKQNGLSINQKMKLKLQEKILHKHPQQKGMQL